MSLNQKTLSQPGNKVQADLKQTIAVTEDLVDVIKNVQEKVNVAKFREYQLSHASNKFFKPLTDPLQSISTSLNSLRKSQTKHPPIQQNSLVSAVDDPNPVTHPATAALKTPTPRRKIRRSTSVPRNVLEKRPRRSTMDARDLTLTEDGYTTVRRVNVSPISPNTARNNPAFTVMQNRRGADTSDYSGASTVPPPVYDGEEYVRVDDEDTDSKVLTNTLEKAKLKGGETNLSVVKLGLQTVHNAADGTIKYFITDSGKEIDFTDYGVVLEDQEFPMNPDAITLLKIPSVTQKEVDVLSKESMDQYFAVMDKALDLNKLTGPEKNLSKFQKILKPRLLAKATSTPKRRPLLRQTSTPTVPTTRKGGGGGGGCGGISRLFHKNKYLKELELKKVVTSRPQYVYWNNVSELIQRLRKLYASKSAGNTSAEEENEIVAIIEELREEKIVA